MNTDTIPAWVLRVLGAIMEMTAKGRPVSTRKVGKALGVSETLVQFAVERLRACGLVSQKTDRKSSGCLRPTCTVEFAHEGADN